MCIRGSNYISSVILPLLFKVCIMVTKQLLACFVRAISAVSESTSQNILRKALNLLKLKFITIKKLK